VDHPDWLPFLTDLADVADEIALRHFGSAELGVDEKPDMTPVTEADRGIEAAIRGLCRERHPELGIFGEEEGETAGSSPTRLIVDPIDATRNFVRGIPVFATLLAIEHEREVVAGMVSAPALLRRWSAARGRGAFTGSRRMQVSSVTDLARAQLFHGSLGGSEAKQLPPGLPGLIRATDRQRGFGDFYQHVLVAEGAGEIALDPIVHPWDIGPLQVLVEEAGGRATTVDGGRDIYGGSLVCSNGVLHDEVLRALRRAG
jgi:histidinol-phosphatase